MLFVSYIFFAFIILFFGLYWKTKLNRILLINIASAIFYSAWNPAYLLLLFFSTAIDYTCGIQIERYRPWKHVFLAISILSNLSILIFFKYFNFLADTLSDLLTIAGGARFTFAHVDVILPVGISFYTFQTMSYTIDVYRDHIKPRQRFSEFFLYVSFFPQLIAGPIERAGNIFPQIERLNRRLSKANIMIGAELIVRGYVKKVVVADSLALYVDQVFGNLNQYPSSLILLATCFFAVQIYCDFSGYTDIARGIAKLIGIDLMENFHFPYFATNIRDFWSRWHISLSTWLRDYLYIPLGGNRGNALETYRNLMITMVLGGLWHGANYTFLAWGIYHGLLLICHRLWSTSSVGRLVKIPSLLAWLFTITCTVFGWYLFRIQSIGDVTLLFNKLMGNGESIALRLTELVPDLSLIMILAAFGIWHVSEYFISQGRLYIPSLPKPLRYAYFVVLSGIYYVAKPASDQIFIYFQF